jgi:hypothetical protein
MQAWRIAAATTGLAHTQHANRCSAERSVYNEGLEREMLFLLCVACNFAYFAPFVPPIPPALVCL